MEIYQVGGSIRDQRIGRPAGDRDYVVIGVSEREFQTAFPEAVRVGGRHAVYYHKGDEYTLSAASTIQENLYTRDLTINALAKDASGRLYSHPKALEDIDRRILRPVCAGNFIQDPLRVFRAARLAASLSDFEPHPSLLAVMQQVAAKGLLQNLAAERVGNETRKAFAAGQPDRFLRLLSSAGALDPWFAEIRFTDQIPAGPVRFHSGSLFEHTCDVIHKLAGDSLTVWMGYCHDLGKRTTSEDMLPHHYGHDRAGVAPAAAAAARLRMPVRFREAGQAAARYHMTAGRYPRLRPTKKVGLLTTLHRSGLLQHLFKVVQADKGVDYFPEAAGDLDIIGRIRLPHNYRSLGRRSGDHLRELRCQALAANQS